MLRSKSPSATLAINSGMRTETGQPVRQGMLWQLRQRFASSIAISGSVAEGDLVKVAGADYGIPARASSFYPFSC